MKLCEAWQWKQANGVLRDMVCRGLLLMLHRAGAIELPAVRQMPLNPFERRQPPPVVPVDGTPLAGPLSQIQPIELRQVRRTVEEPLFNSLIEHHHYLGYEQPVGEHLKWVVWAHGLGITTGRGKDSTSKRPNRSLKEVLGYPLAPHFRDLLSQI